MYTVERNLCNCHPETCNCDDWVIMKNGEKFITVFNYKNAIIVAEALNIREERRKNK